MRTLLLLQKTMTKTKTKTKIFFSEDRFWELLFLANYYLTVEFYIIICTTCTLFHLFHSIDVSQNHAIFLETGKAPNNKTMKKPCVTIQIKRRRKNSVNAGYWWFFHQRADFTHLNNWFAYFFPQRGRVSKENENVFLGLGFSGRRILMLWHPSTEIRLA